MTALAERLDARSAAPAPDPVEAFELRCWARARLWQAGEIDDLHDAVDALQECAVAWGVVASVAQDAVQSIMARAFAAVRDDPKPEVSTAFAEDAWSAPGWREAANEYHETRGKRVLIVETEPELSADSHVPQSTVEALMWCLREQGLACLAESENRDRLARCDAAAMARIAQRLIALQWDPDDVEKLILARRVVGA
jgi:hypothetical protein